MSQKTDWSLLSALGEAIYERRSMVDMSQQVLAEIAGVQRSYVSDVERGRRNVTLMTLSSIARALDTTSADLLRVAQAKTKKQARMRR